MVCSMSIQADNTHHRREVILNIECNHYYYYCYYIVFVLKLYNI